MTFKVSSFNPNLIEQKIKIAANNNFRGNCWYIHSEIYYLFTLAELKKK
jgi:hypothetical protein